MVSKGRVSLIIALLAMVVVGLWHFSSPPFLPSVGAKYLSSTAYSQLGNWTVRETLPSGEIVLGISIANLTFPRTSLSTTYSVVISKVNETVSSTTVRSLTFRVTGLGLEDSHDGATASWGKTNALSDAIQVTSLFFFKTAGTHQLKFTVTYEMYNLFIIGYSPQHSSTRSFNVTQTVL